MGIITNRASLGTGSLRTAALDIMEAGLAAVDTDAVVRHAVRLEGDALTVGDRHYTLSDYTGIRVIGFGKASAAAAAALESILGSRITGGIALSNQEGTCATVAIRQATHPVPSELNAMASQELVDQCTGLTTKDLVLVIVSGGGSAMLCWPASECGQGAKLYEAANHAGMTIQELNTVRKHLSGLKGGGLAKLLAPARVVAMIFSDIPGGDPAMVASGPTYPDASTVADAMRIIGQYRLGTFELLETPKQSTIEAHTDNIVLVSNATALEAMRACAAQRGYSAVIASDDFYDTPEALIGRMQSLALPAPLKGVGALATPKSVVIAGGEPRLRIPAHHGVGGRLRHTALAAAFHLKPDQLFAAVASDGIDNGPAAGALVSGATITKARNAGLDPQQALVTYNEGPLIDKTADVIMTGPTGANVSDLYLLITP